MHPARLFSAHLANGMTFSICLSVCRAHNVSLLRFAARLMLRPFQALT